MRIKPLILAPLCGVLALTLGLLPQQGSASESGNADVVYWNQLIKDKLEEFKTLKESLSLYLMMSDNFVGEFGKKLARDRVCFHQTSYMLAINEPNPFEFKLACFELYKQTSRFRGELKTMEDLLKETEKYIGLIDRSRTELKALAELQELKSDPKSLREIAESMELIDNFLLTLREIKARILKVVEPGRELLAERDASMAKLDESILRNLELNLLRREGAVYEYTYWLFMPHAFKRWFIKMPDFIIHKLPDSARDWLTAILSSLAAATALSLVLLRLFRRRLDYCERRKTGTGALLRRAVVMASVGAGLMLGAFSISMPKNIFIFNLAMAFIAAAALDAGWGLKLLSSAATRMKSPLYPLFIAYLAGMAIQVLDAPQMTVSMLWPPVMAFLAVASWHLAKDKANGLLCQQRRICYGTTAMAILSGMLSLTGFSLLALILAKSWFMLAVSFQFASSISATLQTYVANRKDMGHIASSFALGFGVPTIWLSITTGAMLWMAWQIIDIQTCMTLAFHNFKAGDLQFSTATVLLVAFLFFVVKTALRTLCSALERKADGTLLEPGVTTPFKTMISFFLWTVYALAVVKIFGMSLEHLGVVLGGLSVGLGFGLQNFVNNLVSGLMLLFGRDIREGDIIQIGDTWAKVQKISLRSTLACTTDNAIISIPNSNMLSNQVINWTLNNRHIRRDVKIPLAAGADLGAVKDSLLSIAASAKEIMKLPAPEVFVSTIGAGGSDVVLRVWVMDIEKADHALSELNSKIRAGLMISADSKEVTGAITPLQPAKI